MYVGENTVICTNTHTCIHTHTHTFPHPMVVRQCDNGPTSVHKLSERECPSSSPGVEVSRAARAKERRRERCCTVTSKERLKTTMNKLMEEAVNVRELAL